ncbi:MAG: hypothetical protein U0931_05685 [Vulcanimicrobiota bacterium]
MRGIIHLGDLHKRAPWKQHELLDLLELCGFRPGPEQVFSAYPPPELVVMGGLPEDWEQLQPWLAESECLLRPDGLEQLLPLLVQGEPWRPEMPPCQPLPPTQPGGDWWALDCPAYLEPCQLAAGIRGLEVAWEGRLYQLRDGQSRPALQQAAGFAEFPERSLAMRGGRCRFDWWWLGPRQSCAVARNAHQWPSGHAKKLYGHRDNEPVRGEISRDGEVCLSVYEVDALLSPAPFPWRQLLPGLVALVWPPEDPVHSVFYQKNGDFDDDEDERDGPPVLVLGPDRQQRYALALHAPLVRRGTDGGYDCLGGEGQEYAIFDQSHRRLCTRPGRLLGGHSQRLVVWEAGRLLAEDFSTGQRGLFGYESGPIEWSSPVQGGSNLVMMRRRDSHIQVRLI